MPDALRGRKLQFGKWILDRDRMQLSDGGEVVALQPLVYALLLHFLNSAGRVVAKDELLEAVWKSPFVTDSAVARAVMKLRKIVGDVITTVHGVGYRFDEHVIEADGPMPMRPQPAEAPSLGLPGPVYRPTAILRFVDDRMPHPDQEAAEGLARWLHFAFEQAGLGPLLPIGSSLAWVPHDGDLMDVTAACKAIGAPCALVCRLSLEDGQTVVDAVWGCAYGLVHTQRVVGATLVAAIDRLLGLLGGTPPKLIGDANGGDEVVQAFVLERQGKEEQALSLIESLDAQQPSVERLPMRVRLLRKTGALDRAKTIATEAMDPAGPTLPPHVSLWLLIELAEVDTLRARYRSAREYCDEALSLIEAHSALNEALSHVLIALAQIEHALGDNAAATLLCRRALEVATAEGDQAAIVRAHEYLAYVLPINGRHAEAINHANIAIKMATLSDMPTLQASSYSALAIVHGIRREHSTAVDAVRKALAFCGPHGPKHTVVRARTIELWNLISASRLEEASVVAGMPELKAAGGEQPSAMVATATAELVWRQGHYLKAVSQLAEVLRVCIDIDSELRRHIAKELLQMHLSLGQGEQAHEVAKLAESDPHKWRRMSIAAHLALFEGDRERCVTLLRGIWTRFSSGPESPDNSLNLAWLLLEDGQLDGAPTFWRHVQSISPQHECARLVQYRYRVATQVEPFDAEVWRRLVLSIPGLRLRHGWLADVDLASEATSGAPRKLSELVNQACW
ncbi:winged helix-turn-helix domain-containing protein [Roseateles amylovorans]|uniref:Winged helix-turn-helix domain-containing protein n=1 Tax=Roseateles amylovorans TaxID=2978473 RepID=A0ABY6B4P4_9BURK|nr:winged helix-turn-helix domain-containing protein [Roseateles amylovorans]UXH80338.1 winged helix-turn-helix domain-containing protein [Roseateles amylovorans]